MKQIWAVILEFGEIKPPESTWSEYSISYSYSSYEKEVEKEEEMIELLYLKSKIKAIGVDWEKTDVPDYTAKAKFVDTDSPSENLDIFEGELILSDGRKLPMYMTEGWAYYDIRTKIKSLKEKTDLYSPSELINKHFGN